MTGRAKWDAWAAAGKQYQDPQEAEKRYLEIAQTLGWTQSTTETQVPSSSNETWDDSDDDVIPEASTSGGGGMGFSVSVMTPPPSAIDKSIHGLALSNDVLGLTTLLEQRPETDLDALDQFGYTSLHLACDRGNIDIVKLLLKKGADHSFKDSDNLSPIELAKEAGQSEIEAILSSIH